ncbi:MAG: hypothetical protein ACRET7_05705 [Burkholderiales bacterium]
MLVAETDLDNRIPAGHAAFINSHPYTRFGYSSKLRQGAATYRKAFMAMKFGDPDLDKLLETIFKPSAKQAGFELFRLGARARACG